MAQSVHVFPLSPPFLLSPVALEPLGGAGERDGLAVDSAVCSLVASPAALTEAAPRLVDELFLSAAELLGPSPLLWASWVILLMMLPWVAVSPTFSLDLVRGGSCLDADG